MILCVYSVGAALRAKTTYLLPAILLEESGLPIELAEALIPEDRLTLEDFSLKLFFFFFHTTLLTLGA